MYMLKTSIKKSTDEHIGENCKFANENAIQ